MNDVAARETGTQIYNNLIRTGGDNAISAGGTEIYQTQIWNNVVQAATSFAYSTYTAFPGTGSTVALSYMDYNFYDNAPTYQFNMPLTQYSLSQMRSNGFETHWRKWLLLLRSIRTRCLTFCGLLTPRRDVTETLWAPVFRSLKSSIPLGTDPGRWPPEAPRASPSSLRIKRWHREVRRPSVFR